MNTLTIILPCIFMLTIHSYPLIVSSNLDNLSSSQINHLCSYVTELEKHESIESSTEKTESPNKRFVPFPDMTRFLSRNDKLHHHHHEGSIKSGRESSSKKHDFQAYLCSISKDSEEVSNFISIFIEEHGEPPAFNIFESCEQIAKRDVNDVPSTVKLNELSQFCSNQAQSRFDKRWKDTVGGPMSIDFLHQMLESRKIKSYPYPIGMDPYLVGR